jgi:hypothetical protein
MTFLPGTPLRALQSEAFSGAAIIHITIPQTVETIDSACFRNCESLTSVNLESQD